MSLDLGETILQLDRVTRNLGQGYLDRRSRLIQLLHDAASVAPEEARRKTKRFYDPFLAAQVTDTLLGQVVPPPAPADWLAASVDGSHIDVDRHLPVSCYLLNLGGCVLTYGAQPDARFFSRPHLAAEPDELYLSDPERPTDEEQVTGNLLGLYRTVRELERLAEVVTEVVRECPADLPTLALVDGTLVLWGLAGQSYRPFIRQFIIDEGLLPALEQFRKLAQERRVTLAAYVSLPRVTEVANAIRRCLCPNELAHCRESCSNRRSDRMPCSNSNQFLDRDIFGELLEPGQRSPLYRTNSSVPREYYGERQQVYFYYLNAGEEIARVEVPQWVAEDEDLLSLGHSLIVEQCRKGQGYPVAISEAHEQAVVSGRDRQLFKQMVAETLEREGLTAYTSQKERSKQRPWL